MIRVAIADDHTEMRVALRLLLNLSSDIEVVCEAGDGRESLDCVTRLRPDVLVMDIQMPGLDGFEVTKQIVSRVLPTRVILISIYRSGYMVKQARECGAAAFLPKDELALALPEVVHAVDRGERFFLE